MTAPTLTLAQLRKLDPCRDRRDVAENALPKRRPITAAQAREFGMSFSDIMWVANAVARTDKDVERRLRMWAADCSARVLHIFESERPGDDRPRKAIEATRAYVRGEIDAAALANAADAAYTAADAAFAYTAYAADAAAFAAARAAYTAANAAAWAAAFAAAGATEEAWQFDRLIAWLSDDEPEPWPLPDLLHAEAKS